MQAHMQLRAHASHRGRLSATTAPCRSVRGTRRSGHLVVARHKVDQNAKDDAYNRNMQRQMGWSHLNPYEYHFDRGLYYSEIIPNLICGTQPRNAHEVDILADTEGITHILNLQEDKDMHYWGVKIDDIRRACAKHSINHMRRPAKDFDKGSLRKAIPGAVHTLAGAMAGNGRVYVHCTAGLGRAPGVCIAFLYWFTEMQLDEAYNHLTSIRPCGPKRDAIRGATYDVLVGNGNAHASNNNGHNGHNNGHGNGNAHAHNQHHHHHAHPHGNGHAASSPPPPFEELPETAYATLSEDDRFALQYRVLKGLC